MPDLLRLSCPECRKPVRVPVAAAGFVATCPLCQGRFQVPKVAEVLDEKPAPPPETEYELVEEKPALAPPTVTCGLCGLQMQLTPDLIGKTLSCPTCNSRFVWDGQQVTPLPPQDLPYQGQGSYQTLSGPQHFNAGRPSSRIGSRSFGPQQKSGGKKKFFVIGGIILAAIIIAGASGKIPGLGSKTTGMSFDELNAKIQLWEQNELPEQKTIIKNHPEFKTMAVPDLSAVSSKNLFFKIFGEPKRRDSLGDKYYLYYETRDGLAQLVVDKDFYDASGVIYVERCNLYGK